MAKAIEFFFDPDNDGANKKERALSLSEVPKSCKNGFHCWVDCQETEGRELLEELGINKDVLEDIFNGDPRAQLNVFKNCIFFTLSEVRVSHNRLVSVPVKVVAGETFLITMHDKRAEFTEVVQNTYKEGFYNVAKSSGFLFFELADHLSVVYRNTLTTFCEHIERIEDGLIDKADDSIFRLASGMIRDLLEFRKNIINSREIIHELATRVSPFVSTTTQPYLEKKANLLQRLGDDVTTEREVLSECLALYMGIVSYRTNKVVTRLTAVSTIFLPLSFLVGLYGMNFEFMPELKWPLGYLYFWCVAISTVGVLMAIMKRKKWI
ncbi:MAG: hypothetical protein CMJ78_18850 [Planctomycetaceae bacterium]|nr:hypothetical protein [Planctomycetaceae bacterium]